MSENLEALLERFVPAAQGKQWDEAYPIALLLFPLLPKEGDGSTVGLRVLFDVQTAAVHGMRQAAQHLENVAGGISSGDFDEALQANTAASEFLVKAHEFVASVDSHPELFG